MKPTSPQKRQLIKLQPYVDRIISADRVFFEQNPSRAHRFRHASEVEIAYNEILNGMVDTLSADWRHFVIIRRLGPRVQLSLFIVGAKDADTDLEEIDAQGLFDLYFEEPSVNASFNVYGMPADLPEDEAHDFLAAALFEEGGAH